MADVVMSNLPLRRVLECVSEKYETVIEISKLHNRRYPPSFQLWIKEANLLRQKGFKGKKQQSEYRSVEKELVALHESGYIEMTLVNFYRKELPEETKFYRLSNFGRSALMSVISKKK